VNVAPSSHASAPIDALLLDAGGVLVRPDPKLLLPALADVGIGPSAGAVARAHYVGVASIDRSAPGSDEEALPRYVEGVVRGLAVPAGRRELARRRLTDLMASRRPWSDVVEESRAELVRLTESGLDVAVVSNSRGWIEAVLRDVGVCQVGPGRGAEVRAVIDSHVIGAEKPDPRIFRAALRALGRSTEHAIHVGDSVHFDVEGAQTAGIRAAHFDPFRVCSSRRHEHIASLAGLTALAGR
jgi:putative hydrolase of the HAD superfamily